jgi:hypothetical protein
MVDLSRKIAPWGIDYVGGAKVGKSETREAAMYVERLQRLMRLKSRKNEQDE